MDQQTKNPIIQNIHSQLKQLVDSLPSLQKQEHPGRQFYSKIVEDLEKLSENVSRQDLLLETVTAISKAVGSITDGEMVYQAIVETISDHLNLHYVGLFLLDETGEWVELWASTDQENLREPKKKSRIRVGDETTVGWTTHHKKPHFTQELNSADTSCAEMILPLISRGQIVGALVLLNPVEATFDLRQEDIPLMQGLADQVANSIQNTHLFTTVDRRLQQIIALHNVNLQIGSQFDLQTVLSNVAQVGTKLMGADIGIIRLADENGTGLVTKVIHHAPGIPLPELARLEELDERLSDYVFYNGEAVLANNWAKHPLAKELGYISKFKERSLAILCVPMVQLNKVVGTLIVQNLNRKQIFNENDLYLLSLLAAQATAAIENSRLFNQAENNRSFLKTVIEHIPDPIFIKDRNHTLIEMNRANTEIIGQPKQKLLGKTDQDLFPSELAAKFQQRDDEVFTNNQPFVAEDKTVWADGQEHIAYTRLIPIPEASGRPQYLLGITHDITERKIREAERERLLAETAALYQGNRAIASALSERQVFDALFEQIRQHDPCEISAYHFDLVEDELLWAELVANWQKQNNASYPIGTRFYLSENPQAKLLATAEPIFIDDIATDARLSNSERESFRPTGACSVALLPIKTAGQELGVVLVYFTQPYSFGEDVQRLWLALTDQVGISFSNRQLIQEVAYRAVQIDTAAEVARAASSILELQELLNSTVALICDRFELYYVGAFLIDETKEWAILQAGTGEAGRVQLEKGHRLKIGGDSMIGWAIKNRQARIALDVGKEAVHFQNPDLPDTSSEMAIPLINHNQIIGALTIQSTEHAAFSREDIVMLQTMADQLAIAIENARLFTRAHENEATTKAILNAIPDLMLRLSRDGTYLDVKESGYVASIMSIDTYAGKTISDILPEEIAEQHLKLIEKALDTGQVQIFEHDFSAGGEVYQFESRIVKSGDDEVLAIVRDISERKRAEQVILRRNKELAAINRVTTETATSALDMQTILQGIAREMVQIFEARRSGIALLNPRQTELTVVASYSARADDSSTTGIIIPVTDNPSTQKVIETGKPAVVPRAHTNPQAASVNEILRELETESLMIVPLLARGEVIGTIGIDLDQSDREFTPAEVALAETIAGQIGSTIDNARLFEQMESTLRQREQVTKALRASEQQYRELVESANSIILRLNTRGQVTFLNKFGEEFFGYSQEELLGKPALGTIIPETESSGRDLRVIFEDIIQSPEQYANNENENLRNDGSRVWVLWTNRAILDEEGHLDEILCIGNDVTERKQAEERLAAERNLLRTLIDNIPDYIYVKDTQSRFLLNNTAHLQVLGAESQDEIIGKSDFDIFPKEVAEKYYDDEQEIIQSGSLMLRQREATLTSEGESQWLSTTKVPLRDSQQNIIGLVGISRNITDRQQAEERLQKAFTRTQLLYNISEALTSLTDQQAAFETILGEFLLLLNVPQGRVVLYDPASGHNRVEAQYIDNRVVHAPVAVQNVDDEVDRYIVKNPFPLIIEDVQSHPLTKHNQNRWDAATAILVAPLMIRGEVAGIISGEATQKEHTITQSDIEASKMVADQLSIWLENHQLLEETQYRSNLLQTAAEVSRTASSILDVDKLIGASVNLIRDQFNFYYVGLFIVDQAREWAVLKAGTGEAGRIQLEKGHRLKIGGESMIGWSIHNRQARIALDVGTDRVHFQNPDLLETRSEMALPLVSREEVIGALTVQSQKPRAFSEEDITVLQTMTDQLANAISNARLFESVARSQKAAEILLQETQALQQFSQTLAGTLNLKEILNLFFLTCTKELGFDYVMLSLVDKHKHQIKAIDGVGVSENNIKRGNKSLDSDDIMADIIRTGQTEIITGWDDRFDKEIYEVEGHADWVRLFTPIILRNENIGLVEAGFNKIIPSEIKDSQIRLMRAFVDQVALAIENAQHYEASQRAARREALIKDITTKVRASTDLDQILQTTVKEIGDAIGGKRTYVQLISPANGEAEQNE